MKTKKSKALLFSWIISGLYMIYLISYLSESSSNVESSAETIGTAIAIALIMPHAILVGIALIFNIIAWATNARWAALTAGILYSVSALLMIIYTPFILLQIVLSFIGFSKLKKINEFNKNNANPL